GVGYSERVASAIDAEVQAILNRAYERAKDSLVAHKATLDAVAHALIEAESLEGDVLDGLLLPVGGSAPVGASSSPAS
ncbi:MAG: cell division protein FtsH, partial [Acidimicrobiales bacterium]